MNIETLQDRLRVRLTKLTNRHPAYCIRYDYAGQYALNEAGEMVALNLRGHQLPKDPHAWLVELPHLRYLNLSETGVSALAIPDLPNLVVLNVSDNPDLERLELPDSFPELLRADISRCALREVDWPSCSKLEWLDAGYNKLYKLNFTGTCPKLIFLNLRENELTRLHFPVGFEGLHYLYAGNCKLRELVIDGEMPNLNILDLRKNQLSELPVKQYEQLETLYVQDNPLTGYEEQQIKGDKSGNANEIIGLLRNIAASGEVPNCRAKLVVVGNGRTGKTCLVKRLRGEECLGDEIFTHGISISRLTKEHLPDVKTDQLDLKVWDFGGQEVYYATHQFFLSEEAVYIYAWTDEEIAQANRERDRVKSPVSIGEKWRAHDYWLANIRMHGKASAIVPVKTHCLQTQKTFPYKKLKKFYKLQYRALDFDAKSSEPAYLHGLKEELTRAVNNISILGKPFPRNYDSLIETLGQVRKELTVQRNALGEVSRAKFAELAGKHKIEEKDYENLLSYLRTTGEIIYYPDPDNEQLKDRIFIDPEGLTTAVYKLLKDHDRLSEEEGIFDNDYAKEKFGEANWVVLLELLIAFDLIYRKVTDTGVSFVAPQYLPKLPTRGNAQAIFNGHKREKELQYELRYPHFMPENVMINLLSRYGPYAEGVVYSNAIYFLKHDGREGCVIELVADEDDTSIIQVYTRASAAGRQLAREVLNEFHKLSKKAKLHISATTPRQWVKIKILQKALAEDNAQGEVVPTADGNGVVRKAAFMFLHQQNEIAMPKSRNSDGKTILFLSANPTSTAKLRLEEEYSEVARHMEGQESYRLHSLRQVNASEFIDAVCERMPSILHFAGHGDEGESDIQELSRSIGFNVARQGGLILYDEAKRAPKQLSTEVIYDIFESFLAEGVPLETVIFNACFSEPQARTVSKLGLTVIGTANAIADSAAIAFANGFYRVLSTGGNWESAIRRGRTKARTAGLHDMRMIKVFHNEKEVEI